MQPMSAAFDPLPGRYVDEFAAIARARHFDVDALMAQAGLSGQAGNGAAITFAHCDRLYQLLSQAMDDVCLGVHEHRTPASYVRLLLAYLVQGSDLREALELAIEFFALSDLQLRAGNLQTPVQIAATLRDADIDGSVCFELFSRRTTYTAASDLHDITSLQRVLGCLIGAPLPLLGARVIATRGGDWESYGAVLGCPIEFEQSHNALIFERKYLSYPLRHNSVSIRSALQSRPYEILFPRVAKAQPFDIVEAVRTAIGANFSHASANLDEVAKLLGLSSRRLRWALHKAGNSFQQIKNDCLREAASAYLQSDGLSIAQVAELLGFSETGAFQRSFKRLTGTPPGLYRAQHVAG